MNLYIVCVLDFRNIVASRNLLLKAANGKLEQLILPLGLKNLLLKKVSLLLEIVGS